MFHGNHVLLVVLKTVLQVVLFFKKTTNPLLHSIHCIFHRYSVQELTKESYKVSQSQLIPTSSRFYYIPTCKGSFGSHSSHHQGTMPNMRSKQATKSSTRSLGKDDASDIERMGAARTV